MKNKILKFLSVLERGIPAGEIAYSLECKRSSVSKCLTRMARTGEVHFQRIDGKLCYKLPPAPTSESAASATVPANT